MDIAEFGLPYWRQGDDLRHYLDSHDNVGDAIEAHAQAMDDAAARLRELRAEIEGHDVEIYACTHSIEVDGDQDLLRRLAEKGIVELRPVCHDEDDESMHEADDDWMQSGF